MKESDPQQEIAFIKQIMEDSRRIIIDDGKIYLIWGIFFLIGIAGEFAITAFNITVGSIYFWLGLMSCAWICTLWVVWKKRSWPRAQTFAGKILRAVWIACFIAMTILGFVGYFSGYVQAAVLADIIAAIIGIGYFVSGTISNFNWMRNTAFGWWGGSILMFFFTPFPANMLVFAIMIALFQVIPGIVLYTRWKKNDTVKRNG